MDARREDCASGRGFCHLQMGAAILPPTLSPATTRFEESTLVVLPFSDTRWTMCAFGGNAAMSVFLGLVAQRVATSA